MRDLTISQLIESGGRGFPGSKRFDQVLEVLHKRIVGRERKTGRPVLHRVAEGRVAIRTYNANESARVIRDQTGSRVFQLLLDARGQGMTGVGKCLDDRIPGRNGL